ncbi:MAG: DUF1761 domain-containing protein [Candidatus Magasanikbacteria bacterium]|nr:DUF1761 domain-containing protein [Candidatus Magasanikbacteria bacterium]
MWDVNLWAVLVSAIVSMVIGSIWYGPLFGKKFMAAKGMAAWTPEQQAAMKNKMIATYAAQFVASLLMFYTLAGITIGFGHATLGGGLLSGFVMWFGFVVPLKLGEELWGGKQVLFWLGIGHMLVTLLAAGAIIGIWR